MDLKTFTMPDAGEGLTEADIIKWLVAPGDEVAVNQIIVEIETAKAAVELPSPFAGTVHELHAKEGDTVDVGKPIITIDTAPGSMDEKTEEKPPARNPVLVGYGPKSEGSLTRRRRKPAVLEPVVDASRRQPVVDAEPALTVRAVPVAVLAKPPVRRLAKALGVDLAGVPATGPRGTISRADVESAASVPAPAIARSAERETRVPIRGVRKHTAAAMVSSAFTAPHVTEWVAADVTAMMELRDRVAARREFRDVKVSPLLFVARAVLLAAKRTPEINSVWDEAAGEIVFKNYVNLGIAAATERGLVVPNIRDADQLSLLELAKALNTLTDTARAGKTTPSDMSHGTLTITSVGVFGVDGGTPIINPGESAIFCFGAVRRMPWVVDEQIVPRWVSQLAVSFDHRLIDGQQGSQFLADVAAILTDPGLALL